MAKKNENWLSSVELCGKIFGDTAKVLVAMSRLVSGYPNGIIPGYIEYRNEGRNTRLCLQKDKINWFCEQTGLLAVQKEIKSNGLKTEDWLSSYDLGGKMIVEKQGAIFHAMNKIREKYPEYIQYRIYHQRPHLCLRSDKIDWFCERNKFVRVPINVFVKDKNWLSIDELSNKKIVGDDDTVFMAMRKIITSNNGLIPGVIECRKKGYLKLLCLHRDMIDWFCEQAGLIRLIEKNENLLSAKDLCEKFYASVYEIKFALEKLIDENDGNVMPNYIVPCKCGTNISLCLYDDKIDWFGEKSGLRTFDSIKGNRVKQEKSVSEWLLARDLYEKEITGVSREEIMAGMVQLIKDNDGRSIFGYIENRSIDNSSNRTIFLHRDKIDWFCEQTGFKRKSNMSIPNLKNANIERMNNNLFVMQELNRQIDWYIKYCMWLNKRLNMLTLSKEEQDKARCNYDLASKKNFNITYRC